MRVAVGGVPGLHLQLVPPGSTTLIFSSAEECLRVLRLIPLTTLSAVSFDVPDFLCIVAPWKLC